MKFYIKNLAPLLFTLVIVFLPLAVFGAENTTSIQQDQGTTQVQTPYPSPSTYSSPTQTSLQNPLKVTNFCDLLEVVLQAILIIGMPVAVVFLVIVGFKFILAQGKPEAIGIAQKNLLHTVIGIAIFLGAWTIAKVIAATMTALGVPGLGSCGQ